MIYLKGIKMKPTKRTAKRATAKRAMRKDYDTPKGMLIMKLKKLGTAIEMKLGPQMDIDDVQYRWVDDRINMLERGDRKLTKEEMQQANNLWTRYGA